MTGDSTLRRSGKEVFHELTKLLLSPITLFHLVLVLTLPLWITPIVYLILRTFLFDSNGMIAWSIFGVLSATFLWTSSKFFIGMFKYSKLIRPIVIAKRNGDLEAANKLQEFRSRRPSPHLFTLGMTMVYLCIPIAVALVLNPGGQGGLSAIKDHGKLRSTTRQEDLKFILKSIEKHGIFTPLNR